jgi:pimeloyl-ACP methyl ester carboxylesterase
MRGNLAAVVSVSFVSIVSLASVSPTNLAAAEPASKAIRWEPYPIVSPYGVPSLRGELGHLRVPESRAPGDSRVASSPREIELAFVRLSSTSRRPGAPIVWLAGGPGGSGTSDLDTPVLRILLELRRSGDVIALDQRGTGLSVPRLDCPGTIEFPRDVPLDRARSVAGLETAAHACADAWRGRGVDLAAYNTRESAEDLEDLRIALGAAKLRLFGGSYGTHLALAAIRAHEDRIERVALIGVVGPDHLRRSPAASEGQLEEISRIVRGDPKLSARLPDLIGVIRSVRDRLDRSPVAETVELPDGTRIAVVLGRFDLDWYTRGLLSSRESIAHLPAFFAAMAAGDFQELARTTAAWRSTPAPSATMFAMRCASGASPDRLARIEAERRRVTLSETLDFAEESVCRAWGVPRLPDDFRSPVRSTVPALFVSGSLDGDTPQTNAGEVMRGFPNGHHLLVEGAAHSLLAFQDPRARAALCDFLAEGRVRSDRVPLPPLAFELPKTARAEGALLAGNRESAAPLFWAGGGLP